MFIWLGAWFGVCGCLADCDLWFWSLLFALALLFGGDCFVALGLLTDGGFALGFLVFGIGGQDRFW